MKYRKSYGWFLIAGLFLNCGITLHGQLQVPGKVMGEYSRMKAADVVYLLSPMDPLEIEARKQAGRDSYYSKSLEFAVERPVYLAPERNGAWIKEGAFRVWRVHVISPGASSLGILFDKFKLREDVKVMIYDPKRAHIKGAYTALNNKSSGILAVGHIPGDEIIIDVWGASEQTYQETISPDGYIKIPNLGPLFLNGLTIERATERIKNRLTQIYSGLNSRQGASPNTFAPSKSRKVFCC